MSGKCPKCEKVLVSIIIENIVGNLGVNSLDCITYICPFCFTVLSVGIDPEALKTATKGVVEPLEKH